MANEYTFERRVIYTEYEYVKADSEKEAWEKVNSGDHFFFKDVMEKMGEESKKKVTFSWKGDDEEAKG